MTRKYNDYHIQTLCIFIQTHGEFNMGEFTEKWLPYMCCVLRECREECAY
eukprot:COSAG02_NODE_11073_length_1800_cov_1.426220_1_plen_49_part_10